MEPDDAAAGIEAGGDEIPFAGQQRDTARQHRHIALAAAEPEFERPAGIEHKAEAAGERLAPRPQYGLPPLAGQGRPDIGLKREALEIGDRAMRRHHYPRAAAQFLLARGIIAIHRALDALAAKGRCLGSGLGAEHADDVGAVTHGACAAHLEADSLARGDADLVGVAHENGHRPSLNRSRAGRRRALPSAA